MTTNETRRCEWCGEITQGECGCPAEAEIARLRAERDILLNALTHISEDGWGDSESWQALWKRTKKTARDAMAKAHGIREA